ncbi:aldo/keto reductase [Gellertiella hungarica]|uniref:Aryl-alcohol dehydrogenase-like predicted oxidoreductase n=1 Tax=Gellertiella hungarica TaxID=1572859 RepID=A0A7W6J8P1_9HYPH|nr:aldo/keto reductase [Gellertiella hungarica]MBB4066002.1 aryl-alcohol dehydrogenase-like predicted oxidoreductase [Gellertiella hungarica]
MHNQKLAKRAIGPGGPEVPVFSLGSWNTWDRMQPGEAVLMIERAAEAGAAFFDVAYYNMGPHQEHSRTDILFGEAIRAAGLARTDFQVCGKLWLWNYPDLDFRAQIETSLERAGLDRFDMVVAGDYLGRPDMARIADEVDLLIKDGLVGCWGINNWLIGDTLATLDHCAARGIQPPIFAQLKYGIVRRTVAEGKGYGALFSSGRLGLQASDCMEGGLLIHKGPPRRKIGADVGKIREQMEGAADRLKQIADGLGATPAQVAIAFCLANPATTNVLFGASRLGQLEENLAAAALAAERGAEIRALCEPLWLDAHVSPDGGF